MQDISAGQGLMEGHSSAVSLGACFPAALLQTTGTQHESAHISAQGPQARDYPHTHRHIPTSLLRWARGHVTTPRGSVKPSTTSTRTTGTKLCERVCSQPHRQCPASTLQVPACPGCTALHACGNRSAPARTALKSCYG